ncbi:MAG: AsmA family protein [Rubrivivax sp.]
MGEPRRWRRWLTRGLLWSVVAAVALLALPLLLVAVGITVDAGPWRGQVAQAIGRALQREVRFDGPARITFSLQPELRVGGIRVRNPEGFGDEDFASFGEGHFQLALLPLLRYELQVRDFSARDVRVRLQVKADGRTNWQFGSTPASKEVDPTRQAAGTARESTSAATQPAPADAPARAPLLRREEVGGVAIDKIRLERILLEFVPEGGTPRRFQLDELDLVAPAGQPLTVRMTGQVEGQFPYTVSVEGGSLSALIAGREAWPLKLDLGFVGTRLGLSGQVLPRPGSGWADLAFRLETDDLSQLERLLQASLPPVGAVAMSMRVGWRPGWFALSQIDATMGRTALQGDLALRTDTPVPAVTGRLRVPTLDLQPFLAEAGTPARVGPGPEAGAPAAASVVPAQGADGATEPGTLLDTYRELQAQTFDLSRLGQLDADLELEVGRSLNLPGDVRDAWLAIRLREGSLVAPIRVRAADVPMQGQLVVAQASGVPTFALALGAQQAPLGGLARLLAGVPGVEGQVGRVDVALAARGATLGDVARSLTVTVGLDRGRLRYGTQAGARPVGVDLERLLVELPAGQGLRGRATGALLGERFALDLRGGSLPALAEGLVWPVGVQLRASGARLALDGQLMPDAAQPGARLQLTVDAPRAGSLGRWLGLDAQATLPLRASAGLTLSPDRARVDAFSIALGRSRVNGSFGLQGLAALTGGGRVRPRVDLKLQAPEIDLPQLQALRTASAPPPASAPAPAGAGASLTLDLPVLPRGIDLSDTDFALQVQRLRLPTADVEDIRFDGRIRDGHMPPAPFSARAAGVGFTGTAAVDLRGALPEVALSLRAGAVDIGGLLQRLRIADGIDARVQALQLAMVLRGSRLSEAIERSELQAQVEGGQWTLRNPARQPIVTVAVGRGRLQAPLGAPVSLTLDGTIDRTPVAIRMGTGRLVDLTRPGSRVPFSLDAVAADTRLALRGQVAVPLTDRGGELTLSLSGPRFDALNELARADLPPWGPWSLTGRFQVAGQAYAMPALDLQIGQSRLQGQGTLGFDGTRPVARLALKAPTVQLDDFRFGDWSPVAKASAPPPQAAPATRDLEQIRAQARDAARRGQRLLSRETLSRQEVDLDVQVDQVRSGTDVLGNGKLHLSVKQGRLSLAPAEVAVPGGGARVELDYEPLPGDEAVRVQTRLRVDRFDYGVLARRIQPDSDLAGQFSLHLDLASTAPLEALMQRGSGRLDMAVWPINLKSGVFDLWAVNVFVALLPTLDDASASRVNCAVARFDLQEGRLRQDRLLVDTTRLRATGTAQVDFRDETLAVRLEPRAKRPQFFSVPVPVEVSGRLSDFKVGVSPRSAASAVAGFFGSVVTTPIRLLSERPLPADGADVCQQAMRGAPPTP